jgi:HEAT repeat protein
VSAVHNYPLLMEMGEDAFPAFEVILADSTTRSKTVSGAMFILSQMKTDRRRFIGVATRRLADTVPFVRMSAVDLLGHIGDERDTAPVASLLSDADLGVRYSAARTLSRIGGKRDLEGMDAQLKTNGPRMKENELQHVKKCRDELEKRLKEHPLPKNLIN